MRTTIGIVARVVIPSILLLSVLRPTFAFSSSSSPSSIPPSAAAAVAANHKDGDDRKRFIEIVDLNSPTVERLPASWIESWSTWILDESGGGGRGGEGVRGGRIFTKIPDSDGYVPPASINELLSPLDLKVPQCRLALGIHVREGIIRHIMPAIDLCFEDGQHRNRGLGSVPRAYRWIRYSHEMLVGSDLQDLHIRAFQRRQKSKMEGLPKKDNDNSDDGANNDDDWREVQAMISAKDVAKALERTLFALAEAAPDELGNGSSIVHVLIDAEQGSHSLEYPGTGRELCLVMDDRDDMAHPDEEDVRGKLQVLVNAAMAGSESQYLPDAYKPLFEDPSLRNPRYEQYRARRQSKNAT